VDITVALLIYRSPDYLDFVIESLLSHPSKEHNVQYLIVCNDATEEVIIKASEYASELSKNYEPTIKVVSHNNENPNDWWIQNVYNAWNRCIKECETEYICFVNSDMAFTEGWLDNLARHDTGMYIPTSRLVESGRMPSLPGLISKNFGQSIRLFDREGFEDFAKKEARPGIMQGMGAYMPSLFNVEALRSIGGWSKNNGNTPGDRITFGKLYQKLGLKHVMVMDSIAYHLQRGESAETGDLK
jgi:glycosyltransferase involved in cell wall biosynthesis